MAKSILLLLIFSLAASARELESIQDQLRAAQLVVLGEVVEREENSYFVKVRSWKGKIEGKYIRIEVEKELNFHQQYLFVIEDYSGEAFKVSHPDKNVYTISTMGPKSFLLRDDHGAVPGSGQIEVTSVGKFLEEELLEPVYTRTDKREPRFALARKERKRSVANLPDKGAGPGRLSIFGLILVFGLLNLIAISLYRR